MTSITISQVRDLFAWSGLAKVKAAYFRGEVSDDVLKRTVRKLYNEGHAIAAQQLIDFVEETTGYAPGKRRTKETPKVGDEVLYITQEHGRAKPYIRLPVDGLGYKKGQPVRCRWVLESGERKIVVR